MRKEELNKRIGEAFFEGDVELSLTSCELVVNFIDTKRVLISELRDSNVTFNVKEDVTLIFLHTDKDANSNIKVNVLKPRAKATIRAIAITHDKENFKQEVVIEHGSKLSFSDYKFFGFATDNSSISISAKSKVGKGYSGSEAHQIIRVVTEDKAKAIGQPGLFIDDFDVKASHGNSIGQIDQRTLYYLQSKGMSKVNARWMIIQGLMQEALSSLETNDSKKIITTIKETLGVQHG